MPGGRELKPIIVGYVASRFPEVTQTWMLREMEVVAADKRIECELLSLFPPMKRTGTIHPAAERWMRQLRRPGGGEALLGSLWWLVRAPGRMLGSVALVIAGYARHPALLVRALVTVAVAAAHARSLRDLRIAHLHAHTATYPLLAAWVCHRLTDVPYSFTAHAHDIFMDQSFLRRRLADATFAVAISEFNREFLHPYGGDEATPVHVIRCGIDVDSYRFRPRAPAESGPLRALAIGGFKDYKGHRYLLEALAGDEALERVSLDLVGDGPLREKLERLTQDLGLDGRVTFRGALTEPEVIALLGAADLFVLPSVVTPEGNTEGLPVVLMEALAAGVPAVATRVTGVPELIRDRETGLLAEPGDSADLGRAIKALLADPEAARRRAEAGRALVEAEYDARVTGAALADLLADAASAPRRAVVTG